MSKEKKNLKDVTGINEFLYTWRVENADLLWQRNGEKLKSPNFKVDWYPRTYFSLHLYPNGTEGNEDFVSFFLDVQETSASKRLRPNLYMLDADGSEITPENSEGFWSMSKFGMLGYSQFMSRKTLMEKKSIYLPDQILTLCCRISTEAKPDTRASKSTKVQACSGESFARTQIKKQIFAKLMVIDGIAQKSQKIGEIKSILQEDPIVTFSASFGKSLDRRVLTIDVDAKKDDRIKLAIFKLMILDEKKRRIFWMNTYVRNDISEFESIVLSSHFPSYSEKCAPHEMFAEKFLFLACEFTFTTGFVVQIREKDDYGRNLREWLTDSFPIICAQTVKCPTLTDALMNMYLDVSSHDVAIKIRESSITAHKIMLCSRSMKFQALLKTAETSPEVIEVEEELDTMEKVVYFLYTDIISDINWQVAKTLYSAAMKYAIGLLKEKCSSFIVSNLDTSKVVEILLLAKEHNDVKLIASVKKFVMKNRTAVYSSTEWDNFRESHSNLAVEIMLPN